MAPGEWDWLIALLIQPIQSAVMSQVLSNLSGPIDRLRSPLANIGTRIAEIRAAAQAIPGYIVGGLVSPLASIAARVAGSPQQIGGMLMSPLASIAARVAGSPQQLGGMLMSPLATIGARIAANPQQIVPALVSQLGGIGAATVGSRVALQALPAGLASVGMSWLASDQAGRERLSDKTLAAVLGIGKSLQATIAGSSTSVPPGFLQGMLNVVTGWGQAGLGAIQGFVLGHGQIYPEDASAVATRAFLSASALGATAHLVSTAVELIHPLRMMGFHYLSGFLADMGSFSSISNALIGTMANVGIATPMRWYLNARTRTNLPTMGDLQGMHRKHSLSRAEFAKYAAYWGLDDMWIERFIEYLPADPRLFDILRMAETGIPETSPPSDIIPRLQRMGIRAGGNPDWWLEFKFALAGYDWVDIPKLVQTVHARMSSTERNRLVTTASTNFRDGYMTEADYRVNLAAAGKSQEQIDWRVRAERLAALNDDIDDLVKLFVDKFLKDQLTYDELVIAMVNVGVTPTKTDILARRAAIRKLTKPVDDTAKQEEAAVREMQKQFSRMYKEQYRSDMITSQQYYDSLRAIGIREDVAWATVEIEIARRIGQTKRTEISAAAQAVTRVKTAQQRLYREQYRAGQVDAGTYYNLMVQAGTLPAEARAIVDAEVVQHQAALAQAEASLAQAELTRTRAALERLYRDQFRAYMITAGQYRANLETLGLSAERAAAVVQDEVTNRLADLAEQEAREAEQSLRAAQRAQSALLAERYDVGQIDADQYLAGLLEIGVESELARATVELAEVQRFDLLHRQELNDQERQDLAVQKQQAALYTRRYRAGELTLDQYRQNLVDIGIPEPLAAATAQLELQQEQEQAEQVRESLVIPAIKRAWTLFVQDAEARLEAGELNLEQYVSELVFSGLDEDIARIVALAQQRIRTSEAESRT